MLDSYVMTRLHKSLSVLTLAVVLCGAAIIVLTQRTETTTEPIKIKATRTPQPHAKPLKSTPKSFDHLQYSTTDPNSFWIIVNKQHPLEPKSFAASDLRLPKVHQRVPGATEMQLRDAAASALEAMFKAAADAGYELQISTAYRGYAYQKTLYDAYAASDGVAQADTYSARPGYSEHQTGLALDIRSMSNQCPLKQCFGNLPEGKWLAANAYKFGFILRYTKDKESITGYHYEPWHFRYVGNSLALEMHKTGIETLEEFFKVSGGTVYR